MVSDPEETGITLPLAEMPVLMTSMRYHLKVYHPTPVQFAQTSSTSTLCTNVP